MPRGKPKTPKKAGRPPKRPTRATPPTPNDTTQVDSDTEVELAPGLAGLKEWAKVHFISSRQSAP